MIITASLIHLNAVCELEQQFGAEAFSKRSLRHFILQNKLKVFVDNFGNVIGSAILLRRKNSNTTRLYSFIIDNKYRDKGIGQVYLEVLLQDVQTKYIKLEVSENNTAAIKIYTKQGFAIVDHKPNYYKDNSTAIVMKKTVDLS